MDFTLSDELQMLREMARDFATEKIAPFADEWDENHYFPYKEVMKPMAELGFFGTVIPEEYGGNEMGWLAAIILTEEIARASSSLRVQINMQTLGCAFTILTYGSDELKKKYIEKLVTAEYIGGFGITEPNAGSDIMAMKSTAEDKGDHWLVNGYKTWISNATIAVSLDMRVEEVESIIDELERGMTFLYRGRPEGVTWAYPVTVDSTPHRVTFDSGEQTFAA